MTNLSPRPRPDREPIPRHFQVPEVRVIMKWPFFEDSRIADPHGQENIERTLDGAWYGLSQDEPIDSNCFWGQTAEYWLDGETRPLTFWNEGPTGNPMIAVANYRHFEKTFADFLPRLEGDRTPTPRAMLVLLREMLGTYDVEAWQMAFQGDGQAAIELLERRRQETVAKIEPAWLLFWSADTSKKIRAPLKGRDPLAVSLAEALRAGKAEGKDSETVNSEWFEKYRAKLGKDPEAEFARVKSNSRRILRNAEKKPPD